MSSGPAASTRVVTSPDEIAQQVHDGARRHRPIVDYGVAHQGVGHPPPANHVRVTLRGTILEQDARDLTVLASSGVTIGQLQAALGQVNQFLPVDADDDLTLGEVITHHVYGPLRVGYGSVRDWLLGLGYIDGLGRDVRVGGRTVKNVAGYDVTRLMVGSLGELGYLHEATVRAYAIPQLVLIVEVQVDQLEVIDKRLTEWLCLEAGPTQLGLHIRPGVAAWVRVGYMGSPAACRSQLDALGAFVARCEAMRVVDTREITLAQDATHRAGLRAWRRSAQACVKLVVPPAVTGAACRSLQQQTGERGRVGAGMVVDALPVHGCVFIGGALDTGQTQSLAQIVQRIAGEYEGFWVWHKRPGATRSIQPFGPVQPDWSFLARLKQVFDPRGLFNPGRFLPVGGQVL